MSEFPNEETCGSASTPGASCFMLDTNIFNRLVDGRFDLSELGGGRWLASGIQRSELEATSGTQRRADLLAQMDSVAPDVVQAASFALDIAGAGFDEAHWNDGSGLFERLLDRLVTLDKARGKRPKDKRNQLRDALITETAIREVAVLVTADPQLGSVAEEFGGEVILIP